MPGYEFGPKCNLAPIGILVRVGATTNGPPHENTPKTAKKHTFKLLINQQQIKLKISNQRLLIRFALFLVCTLQNLIYLFNTKVIDGFLEQSDKFAQNRIIYIQKSQK